MLRKNNLLLVIIFSLFLNNFAISHAKPKLIEVVKKKPNPIVKTPVTKTDEFDFRKIKWDMSPQEVQESEKSDVKFQDNINLIYSDKLFGHDAKVVYYFEKAKLKEASYIIKSNFSQQTEYIEFYYRMKNILSEKYGKPDLDNNNDFAHLGTDSYKQMIEMISNGEEALDTTWETPRTKIQLLLNGKNILTKVNFELNYSKKYTKATEKEKDKDLDKNKF
jgi:hypothetical protein